MKSIFCLPSILALWWLSASTWAAMVPRHPLELLALKEPNVVLKDLPAKIQQATLSGNSEELALLQLARANACRVIADWSCQQLAAEGTIAAAQRGKLPILEIRGLIAQARARISQQDFSRGEDALARAELLLRDHPHPDLAADVYLAYSSLSFAIERFETSRDYAQRGIKLYSDITNAPEDIPTHIRLLRNLGRSQAALGNRAAARETLDKAQLMDVATLDPKLAAELHLEAARMARLDHDVTAQQSNADAVLELADQLKNEQLRAQAWEALGLAALDRGEPKTGYELLAKAFQATQAIKSDRDAVRIFRLLMPVAIQLPAPDSEVRALMLKGVALQDRIEHAEKSQAAGNFDARLRYAEREFELNRLEVEHQAAIERESLLRKQQALAFSMAGLSMLTLLIVAASYHLQRRAKRKLETSERRLKAVTDNVPAQISQFDASEQIVFANPEAASALSLSADGLMGKSLAQTCDAEAYARRKPHVMLALGGKSVMFEDATEEDAEHKRFYQVNLVPDIDAEGVVRGFYSMQFDITRLKEAEQVLAQIAQTDPMTGVANRRALEAASQQAIASAQAHNTAISLLVLDIDRFKSINDSRGHQAGDEVIRQFAKRLQACVRKSDLIARLGGDEFVILLTDTPNQTTALKIASAIIDAMRAPMLLEDGALPVTTSIGVGHQLAPANFESLYELADGALYQAKSGGRNRYEIRLGDVVQHA